MLCTGFKQCHIRDGAALCAYLAWLEDMLKRNQPVDEMSGRIRPSYFYHNFIIYNSLGLIFTGADKLEKLRSEMDLFVGLSFDTISASGPNGAIIHYKPREHTKRFVIKFEFV